MNQDQSLVIIDATDATVLPPENALAVFDVRQKEELDKCEFHLSNLGPRIMQRANDLVYLCVEAGWWLMRARATHLVAATATRSDDGRLAKNEGGFLRWFEQQGLGVKERQAYAWMQAATNAGLKPDSNIQELRTLREAKTLHGRTLTDLARKPVDKSDKQAELHEVTEEEQQEDTLKGVKEAYRLSAQFLAEQVTSEQTWALLPDAEYEAYGKFLDDANRAYKAGARKRKPLPSPKGNNASQT